MNANELTFGIEIETTMPANYYVGSYHGATQAAGLPAGWTAQHDSSIQSALGRRGCEFVSPVLVGATGLQQVVEVVAKIRELGGEVNASTGLHVHVGVARDNQAAIDRLISLVAFNEKAIFATTGTKKREQGAWCRSIRQHGDITAVKRVGEQVRYHVLNLRPLLTGQRAAVEFRAFAGTLNAVKITGYIMLCLALVEKACDACRTAAWTPKEPTENSPVRRNGEGATNVARMYYLLGWTKGRVDRTYGEVTGAQIPTIAEVKKEFKRLVRKYDGE